MSRNNLIPVSTRLDPETVEKIDQFVIKRRYWKRNSVICSVLKAVFDHFPEKDIYDMVRLNPWGNEEVDCHFEIKKKEV